MERYNVMAVGDRKTGKTCLCFVLQADRFPVEFILTVCNCYHKRLTVGGKECVVAAYEDSSHGECYDRLRPFSYPKTNVFIALFSVDSRDSLENLKRRWIPEVRSFVPQAPVIIVANKIDLREDSECHDTISSAEGYSVAKQMGTSYFEVSCKLTKGVHDCFIHAVEIAKLNTKQIRENLGFSSILIPPLKPPAAPESITKAAVSMLTEDWRQALSDARFYDIKFVLNGGDREFLSHKIVLCTASSFFRKLLVSKLPTDANYDDFWRLREDINFGRFQGMDRIYDNHNGRETTLELSGNIKAQTFSTMLEVMYTDSLPAKLSDTERSELNHLAKIFDLVDLISHLNKTLTDQDENDKPEFFSVSDDKKGKAFGEFFKQDTFSDLTFDVGGSLIPAHRVVVWTRNSKMAALVDSNSGTDESSRKITVPDVVVDIFSSFLEFLYTDQIDLNESSDVIGVLSLANMYEANRLVGLCEVYLRKEVENTCEKLKEGEVLNAGELLRKFKACKASQMVDWCRHYICHNYTKFEDKEEFQALCEDDKIFIKQRRWPPITYIYEMKDFERIISSISTTETNTSTETEKKKCVVC